MRIYSNFTDSMNEIKRDLAEMGINIHPHSYQNKDISHDPNFATLELQNYIYTVTDPDVSKLSPTQPWADAEFNERTSRKPLNPGEAYKLRPEVWDQFLDNHGKFDYTYPERFLGCIDPIIEELRGNLHSRQLFLPMFDKNDLTWLGGEKRIPCTLGYLFQYRQGMLNITYLQRSADFATHFHNDCYLAVRMMQHIAAKAGLAPGMYTHYIGSLHIFKKDIAGVF